MLSRLSSPCFLKYLVTSAIHLQLHLTPLHAAVQLKPSLRYLDAADEARKKEAAADAAAAEDGDQMDEDEGLPDMMPVQVRYGRFDSLDWLFSCFWHKYADISCTKLGRATRYGCPSRYAVVESSPWIGFYLLLLAQFISQLLHTITYVIFFFQCTDFWFSTKPK